MAVEISEKFQVEAPIEDVWRFMIDLENVATCMPGASLTEKIDDRTFVGSIKLKVGAVTAGYQGKISFADVDAENHRVEMLAEAKEKGGGTLKGTISSHMSTLSDGRTEVLCEARVDLTGRIMQVARGMIQGVSQQLFKKFVANARQRLEVGSAAPTSVAQDSAPATSAGATPTPAAAEGPSPARSLPAPVDDDSIAVLPLLIQTFLAWLKGIFVRK